MPAFNPTHYKQSPTILCYFGNRIVKGKNNHRKYPFMMRGIVNNYVNTD